MFLIGIYNVFVFINCNCWTSQMLHIHVRLLLFKLYTYLLTYLKPPMFRQPIHARRNMPSPCVCLHYTVSQKVPTFIPSVTLSNLNRFSHFLYCWKAYEICYKSIQHYPLHLRRVPTLPREIKNSNFWPPVNYACVPQRFSQLINTTLCPVFLRKFVCQPFYCVPFSNINFLLKSCPGRWISYWLLTKLQWRVLWPISGATNWLRK